jgi:16S rRNA processing protein RimM
VTADHTIVGRIRKPHGVHGELLIETTCDDPDAVFASGNRVVAGDTDGNVLGPPQRDLIVSRARPFKDGLLVTFASITDRNLADEWRHRFLLVPTAELPPPQEGEVWVHELAGMRVNHVDGSAIGDVVDVDELPQGYLLEITTPAGRASIPFVDAIVVGVDRDARVITIDPPEGLLDL